MKQATFGKAVLPFLGLTLFLGGCGGSNLKPAGKVLKGGKPFTLSEKGVFVIGLIEEKDEKRGNPHPVDTKTDGTFKVVGREGKGIAPGRYYVAVEAFDPYPGNDLLKGAHQPSKTKLTVEVKGSDELVIDVGK